MYCDSSKFQAIVTAHSPTLRLHDYHGSGQGWQLLQRSPTPQAVLLRAPSCAKMLASRNIKESVRLVCPTPSLHPVLFWSIVTIRASRADAAYMVVIITSKMPQHETTRIASMILLLPSSSTALSHAVPLMRRLHSDACQPLSNKRSIQCRSATSTDGHPAIPCPKL